MAHRSGTYVAFHADGNNIPGGKADIDYYNLLCAWDANQCHAFKMVNSHEKASAVRDGSKRLTLRNSLLERLRNSKNMVLIVGETKRLDTDWVPFDREGSRCVQDTDHRRIYGFCQGSSQPQCALRVSQRIVASSSMA